MSHKSQPSPDAPTSSAASVDADQLPLPLYSVSYVNRLTFSWLDRLFIKGWKKPLVLADLYQIPRRLRAQDLSDSFFSEWDKVLKEYLAANPGEKRPNPNGKLLRVVVWNLCAKQVMSLGIMLIFSNACSLLSPYFVQYILNYALSQNTPSPEPVSKGLGLAFGLLLTQLLGSFLSNQYTQEASVSAISLPARQEFNSGNVINLVSTDTNRIEQFINQANYVWVIPIVLVVNASFLISSLGWPAVVGIAILVFSGPAQATVFSFIARIRGRMAPITGKRVNLTTEVLSGIRVIKFFAWEDAFVEKVLGIRESELSLVLQRSKLMSIGMTLGFSTPVLCSCITFVIYGTVGSLNVADIFSSMAWFNQLRMPLFMLPMVLNTWAEFNIALRRIEALLLAAEVENEPLVDPSQEHAVVIENGQFEWSGAVYGHGLENPIPVNVKGPRGGPGGPLAGGPPGGPPGNLLPGGTKGNGTKPAAKKVLDSSNATDSVATKSDISSLKDINLKIKRGELVAIVGAVGSGKSSLLNALIGEMKTVSGSISFSGTLGYAAQSAWIQNATLKDNVLFGKDFDKQRYLHALVDSALLPDLKVLQDADLTSIGERGINLSGGQKQRVNMARVLYGNSDIVLIDDPLSAVDAHVGKHLFSRCIKGALAGRTRLLITHQLHYLPQCDKIVFMKDGRIAEQGTFSELMEAQGGFAKMFATYGSSEDTDDEDNAVNQSALREAEVVELEKLLDSRSTGKDIMTVEDQETGKVAASVWWHYAKASGGVFGFAIPLFIILVVFQSAYIGNNLWLTWWTDNQFKLTTQQYAVAYLVFGMIMVTATYGFAIFFAFSGTRASRALHEKALRRIIRSPANFYDTTPLGRIINRFSRDVDAIDNNLTFSFRQLFSQMANTLGTFIVMCSAIPWFTIPCIPALVIYYFISMVYRTTARELKRLDSTSKSPLYTNFGETLVGIATIRAYADQNRFIIRNDAVTNTNNSPYFLLTTAANWLSFRLQMIGALLVLCAALIGVLSKALSPSLFGLCLSYSLSVTQVLSMLIQNFTQCEISMNSVERVETYAYRVPVEADAVIAANRPPPEWPLKGAILFKNVIMRYAPDLPVVLNNVSFAIADREKIGIVGRTGSGKSSLMQALFRMVEPESGSIVIDGVDILKLGLADLRSRIAIIPQDPVVFSGTFRTNLDPFAEHTDAQLWDALERAGLKPKVAKTESQLDAAVDAGGENLSVGERQLLCLARAMLRRPRILIMDEATANVDYATDAAIQQSLRADFSEATVLTIAHRLNTVIDYDRVMVLDKGEIAEFDAPRNLLADETSLFSALVAQTGESNAQMLKGLAGFETNL
ncbi:hypothetical protein HDU83_001130 [Entophlyctis luteolus]|nr:hypothetical protein HDU83_001130 [Entophlyctis luteolus]